MIQKINSISNVLFINNTQQRRVMSFASDNFYCENKNINKAPLIERGILTQYQSVNRLYEDISKEIFKHKKSFELAGYLKKGDIAFSTSILSLNEVSAAAIELDSSDNIDLIRKYVQEGIGLGFNFSKLDNPIEEIKKINFYYKAREDYFNRPPAFIGLLNIDNKDIDEFIQLKTKERFSGWCFDLSVVIDDKFMEKLENGDKKALKTYDLLLESMAKTGEPGVIFSNDKNYNTDCCAAVKLEPKQGFSIASVNLSNMYINGKIDYSYLRKCSDILSLAMNKFDNPYIGVLGYGDLLDKLGIKYGSNEALEVLSNCLSVIKKECDKNGIQMALSPTGATSRILKTTPSIEPKKDCTADEKLNTLEVAYKYLSENGQISTTVNLNEPTKQEIDHIIKTSYKKGIKGITVFPNK